MNEQLEPECFCELGYECVDHARLRTARRNQQGDEA